MDRTSGAGAARSKPRGPDSLRTCVASMKFIEQRNFVTDLDAGKILMVSGNLAELENTIGYSFQNSKLLLQAVTHSSYCREPAVQPGELFNEQMEFLGDAILGFLVSKALVERFPDDAEGFLSKRKAHLVSEAHLYQVARRIAMGQFLRLGKGEEQTGGRVKKALLADALEALIAAIYLDGGLEPTRRFVHRWILESVDWQQVPSVDYKSELQEFLHEIHSPQPRYIIVREQGPEHHKVFTVQLEVGGTRLAQAEGESKKAAQQAAAQIALARLRSKEVGTRNHKTD